MHSTWYLGAPLQLAVSNGLRILLVRGYDRLHHIKDDDLVFLRTCPAYSETTAPGYPCGGHTDVERAWPPRETW